MRKGQRTPCTRVRYEQHDKVAGRTIPRRFLGKTCVSLSFQEDPGASFSPDGLVVPGEGGSSVLGDLLEDMTRAEGKGGACQQKTVTVQSTGDSGCQ